MRTMYFMGTVKVKALLAQTCPTLGNLVNWGLSRLLCPRDFSGKNTWSGLPFPSPGDLPAPGIEPGSPVLQAEFFTK